MTRALYTVSNGDHKADSTLYCEQKRPERRKQNETAHFGISSIAETGNLDGENVLCAVLEYFRNMQKATPSRPRARNSSLRISRFLYQSQRRSTCHIGL
jgi:hypothetical protein